VRKSVTWCATAALPSAQSIAKSPWITSVDEMSAGLIFRKAHGPSAASEHSA